MYNSDMAYAAQKALCERLNIPNFAPGKYNGYRCHRCGQDIFAEIGHPVERLPRGKVRLIFSQTRPGISVEKAGEDKICGCPFCCASFDD